MVEFGQEGRREKEGKERKGQNGEKKGSQSCLCRHESSHYGCTNYWSRGKEGACRGFVCMVGGAAWSNQGEGAGVTKYIGYCCMWMTIVIYTNLL